MRRHRLPLHLARAALAALATIPTLAAAQPSRARPAEHRVALPTGVSLKYVEAGPRTAPVVVLLHGYIDSHQAFEPILPALAERFRVIAPDQRGHGDSDKPECCYAQGDYVADVRELMRALNVRRATIVGHSMGAAIAHKLAVEHPELVDRLVLIGGSPTCAACREYEPEIMKVRDPVDQAFVRELQKGSMHAPVREDYFERVIAQSMKVPAHVWHRAWKGLMEEDHADRLSGIRARTLIVAGDKDSFGPPDVQRRMAGMIPGATLLLYEETGHWPYAERTDRFLKDFLAWMERR